MICYLISQSSWPSLLLIIINPCPRWSPPAWITLQIPTTNWDVMYMYDPKLHKLWTSFIIIYHQYDLDHHLSSFIISMILIIIYHHLSSCIINMILIIIYHHLSSFIIIYHHVSSIWSWSSSIIICHHLPSFIIIYHQYVNMILIIIYHHLSSFIFILSSICQYDLDHHLTSFIIIYSHLSSFIINIILMMLDLQDIGYQPPVGSPPKGGAPCQGSPKWTKRVLLAVSSNPGPRGIEGRQVQGLFMGYDYGNGIFH
jgi:hypothetical protein